VLHQITESLNLSFLAETKGQACILHISPELRGHIANHKGQTLKSPQGPILATLKLPKSVL
jgi:hypothetical protein